MSAKHTLTVNQSVHDMRPCPWSCIPLTTPSEGEEGGAEAGAKAEGGVADGLVSPPLLLCLFRANMKMQVPVV